MLMKTDKDIFEQLLNKETLYWLQDMQITAYLSSYTGNVEFSDKDGKGDLVSIPMLPSEWLSNQELEDIHKPKGVIAIEQYRIVQAYGLTFTVPKEANFLAIDNLVDLSAEEVVGNVYWYKEEPKLGKGGYRWKSLGTSGFGGLVFEEITLVSHNIADTLIKL